MTEQEERFVSLYWNMHTLAKQAAEVRKSLIEAYVARHYSGISCIVTIVDDNILAVDVAFPGLTPNREETLINEITDYLQGLLVVGKQQ